MDKKLIVLCSFFVVVIVGIIFLGWQSIDKSREPIRARREKEAQVARQRQVAAKRIVRGKEIEQQRVSSTKKNEWLYSQSYNDWYEKNITNDKYQIERRERHNRWLIESAEWREELRLATIRERNREANDNAWLDRQNQKIINDWRIEEGQPNPYNYIPPERNYYTDY